MVEVLNRLGRARWRQRLDTFPATIGRSPSCLVIVDERDVSAVHARVVRSEDGTLALEDAGSANGIFVGQARLPRVVLGAKTEVRLGSVRLRFVSADAPVEKTFVGQPPSPGRWGLAAALCLPALGLVPLLERQLSWAWALNFAEQIYSGMTLVVTLCVWAFLWSLATRVFQGTFRFVEHLGVASLGLTLTILCCNFALPVAGFAFSVPRLAAFLVVVAALLILTGLLAGHIVRVTLLSPWKSRAISVGVIGTLALLAVVQQIAEDQKPSAQVPVQGVVMPPGWLLRSPQSPDALFQKFETLKEDVDALRTEGR